MFASRSPAPPPATSPQAQPEAGDAGGRRGALLITGVVAAAGGAAAYLATLPAELRASIPYGICFALLGLFQIGTVLAVLVRPSRRWLLTAAAPLNTAVGITGAVVAGLEILSVVLLAIVALRRPRRRRTLRRRLLTGLAAAPLSAAVLASVVLAVAAATDGFVGGGLPAGAVAPGKVPTGQRGTVEYCRPHGVPLAMDLYPPSATAREPAPVVLYVHGGGLVLGDRKTTGLGAALANHDGALFSDVRRQLNARGFLIASIDYRLPPATAWPAQIQDAKCAVRFLRAHAAALGIDPARIAAWGSSAGATLACLLGLAGPSAGFDIGQYPEQSSAVQAVVDMFSPTDLTDLADSSSFMRTMVRIGLGGAVGTRRAASPITYVRPGAPPFLIIHGTEDQYVRPRHSERLARELRASGAPATLIQVDGAPHSLDIEGQRPSPSRLAGIVVDFLGAALA